MWVVSIEWLLSHWDNAVWPRLSRPGPQVYQKSVRSSLRVSPNLDRKRESRRVMDMHGKVHPLFILHWSLPSRRSSKSAFRLNQRNLFPFFSWIRTQQSLSAAILGSHHKFQDVGIWIRFSERVQISKFPTARRNHHQTLRGEWIN